AEADDAGSPVAFIARGQEAPGRLQRVERRAGLRVHLADGAANAADPRFAVVEVRGEGHVSAGRELVGLSPDVVVEPERLVNHDDARPRARAAGAARTGPGRRDGEVSLPVAGCYRIGDVRHADNFSHLAPARSPGAVFNDVVAEQGG